MKTNKLSHVDENGNARMVDVGSKVESKRIAVAKGEILMKKETLSLIHEGLIKKGDVLTVAKIAGIGAAKNTSTMIPLCHQIALTSVDLEFFLDEHLPGISIKAQIETIGKTGVEMEALVAVSVAALTIYDMAKAVERTMVIQNIRLIEKHGGSSGIISQEKSK